jgi:hypothetical protein
MVVNRRALWLGAMLGVAIVAAIVVRSTGDAPPSPAASAARPAAPSRDAARGGAVATQEPLDLNLEVLGRERGEPIDRGRNPFTFRPKPAPPPPPSPPRPTDQSVVGPAMPMVPAGPPPPPPIALKLIGIVEKADGTRIAVLSDGKRPIHGREGEEIEGRYKIWKIGLESIELSYLDGRGRRTIALSGQ